MQCVTVPGQSNTSVAILDSFKLSKVGRNCLQAYCCNKFMLSYTNAENALLFCMHGFVFHQLHPLDPLCSTVLSSSTSKKISLIIARSPIIFRCQKL